MSPGLDDDRGDARADGWSRAPSREPVTRDPDHRSWSLEDGTLAQNAGGDWFHALVQGLVAGTQDVATDLWQSGPNGYGGVTLWYQDVNNFVAVILYPAGGGIRVYEMADGSYTTFTYEQAFSERRWYRFRVQANSDNGRIGVFLDDTRLFTYKATTPNRIGLSGLFSGNAGGYFDNFSLTAHRSGPAR